MKLNFKTGLIKSAEYYKEDEDDLLEYFNQNLVIECYDDELEDVETYIVTLENAEEFYGVGDTVSFLEENGNIYKLRLSNQQII